MAEAEVKIKITAQDETGAGLENTEKTIVAIGDAAKKAAAGIDEFAKGAEKASGSVEDLAAAGNDFASSMSGKATSGVAKLNAELKETPTSAKSASTEIGKVGTAASATGQKLDALGTAAEQSATKFAKFKEVGSVLQGVGGVLAGIGGAITGALVMAANEFGKFQTQLKQIQIDTGATDTQMTGLSDTIKAMATSSSVAMADITAGFAALDDAGLTVEDLGTIMTEATELMAGYGASATQATGVIQTAMKLFGKDLSEVGNVADTVAVALGSLSFDELSASLSAIGPIASQAGVSFEDTTAALMAMKGAGLPVEQAVMGLKQLFVEIINPSDNFKASLDELGISLETIQDPSISLGDKMKLLAENGYTAADAMKDFGERAGASVAVALKDAGKAVNDYSEALEKSGGAAEKAAKENENSWAGMVTKLKNTFSVLTTTIGQSVVPVFQKIIDAANNVMNAFNGLPQPVKDFLVPLGAIAGIATAAIGGLSMLAGAVLKGLENFKQFGTMIKDVVTKIPEMVTGIKDLALKFADLAVAAGKKIFDVVIAGAKSFIESIKATAKEFSGLQGLLKAGIAVGVFAALTAALSPVIDAVKKARVEVQGLVDSIAELSGGKVNIEMSDMEKFAANLVSLGGLIPGVKEGLETMFVSNKVTDYNLALSANYDLIMQLATAFAEYKKGTINAEEFGKKNEEIQGKIQGVVDKAGGMGAAFGSAAPGVEELRKAIANDLSLAMSKVSEDGKAAAAKIEAAFQNIKTNPDLLPADVVEKFNARVNQLNFKTLEQAAQQTSVKVGTFFDALGKEIAAKLGVVDGFEFSTIPGRAQEAGKKILSAFVDVGVSVKEALGVINGLKFDGLAVSMDDAKKRISDALIGIGYSASDAATAVNKINFEELKRKSEGAQDTVVDAFTQAKNDALAALKEIDQMKFDTLALNFQKAIGEAVLIAIEDVDTLTEKLNGLQGTNVKIVVDLVEGTA